MIFAVLLSLHILPLGGDRAWEDSLVTQCYLKPSVHAESGNTNVENAHHIRNLENVSTDPTLTSASDDGDFEYIPSF